MRDQAKCRELKTGKAFDAAQAFDIRPFEHMLSPVSEPPTQR
jgi:hypothetical protein